MSQSRQYTKEELEELKNKSVKFHNALFNKKIDENIIVEILSNTTNEERQIIRGNYKKLYNHPIQNDIKSKLTGKLRDISIDMIDTPYEYDARQLHSSLNSLTNDDNITVEIFASRPKNHLEIVDKAYQKFYKISLKEDIKEQGSKEFAEFLLAIMDCERPLEQTISGSDAYETANDLIKNGLKIYGTDVNLFKKVFVEKSREDLILISRAFFELSKKSLYDAIEAEVVGKNRRLLKGLLFAVITPAQWFAKKCYKAIQGLGGDNDTLARVLISRAEIDMYAIRDYYYMDTNNDIKNDIDNDLAYGQILVNLSLK
jgi:annexin A7/11